MVPENYTSILDFLMDVFTSDLESPKNVKVDESDDLPFTDDECADNATSCDGCAHFDECMADEMYDVPDFDVEGECYEAEEPPMWGIPDVRRVVFSGPATIVFWEDNTKTVVKCMAGEKFERYAGFAAACMKKMFGSTSRAKAVMEECAVDELPYVEKKKHKAVPDLTEALNNVIANHESIQEAINETFNG